MVLADSVSAHSPNPDGPDIEFHYREANYRRRNDHIFDWNESARVTTGKVTLNDYDFEKPTADQKTVKAIAKGKHSYKNYEHYRYPGHIRNPEVKDRLARVRMEALAVQHEFSRGVGNVRTLGVGQTFKLKEHPRSRNNKEYLIAKAVHNLQIETDYEDEETKLPLIDNRIPVDDDNPDTYRCVFDVIPKSVPFRAPHKTPWPEIVGLQTALVTGPAGEEIHTDKYGRIKVQFYWDRIGQKDDKTTCWVRCVMPWTGKNWGMVFIPRIGQEVAIQFEEGDPDRPICTGMLYNANTMPPYGLPGNMTQTGIKTRSSKQGGADNFNELVFEDKKGEEFVRFQSEKDYTQIIKNDATITIGLETKDKGDLTQTIQNHKTETLKKGNHTTTVEAGNMVTDIQQGNKTTTVSKGDQTVEVSQGNRTMTVNGDVTNTVKQGNYTQTIKQGNYSRTVKMGNYKQDVKMGNHATKVNLGSITQEAMQKIEMKVGSSSIKIDQTGVTIKGLMIKIEGTAGMFLKAPMIKEEASAVLILKGGVTMIN